MILLRRSHICIECGKLRTTAPRALYCGSPCRQRAYRRRAARKRIDQALAMVRANRNARRRAAEP